MHKDVINLSVNHRDHQRLYQRLCYTYICLDVNTFTEVNMMIQCGLKQIRAQQFDREGFVVSSADVKYTGNDCSYSSGKKSPPLLV